MAKGPVCSLSELAGGCQAGEGRGSHPVPAACPGGAVGMPKEPGKGAGEGAGTSVCLAYPGECWKVN